MAFSVVMPALEMAQETGKLIAWRKQEGDRVTKGEPLLEIETDKAVMEVEAPADGILAGITGQVGTDIQVGKTIAWIVAPGEKPPAENESAASVPAARAGSQAKAESQTPPAVAAPEPSAVQSARISPKARRLAKELGVDIAAVRGTGPSGEILASDVQAAAACSCHSRSQLAKNSGSLEVPSTLGRLMAERTTKSWTTVPHFFVTREIEATALNEYRGKIVAEIEKTHKIRITHTDLLVALVARVLLKHPRLNSSWTAEGIRLHDHVNMGVAIAVNDGVVAAVIPNAHTAQPGGNCHPAPRRGRARSGREAPSDRHCRRHLHHQQPRHVSRRPVHRDHHPAASGNSRRERIADRVVAVEGKPAVRPMITLTLSCDHRAGDGARAAMFLNDLAEAVRDPSKWFG
jgi:pyruvate dehydrogenase E2 component (dihydrolipoamide acetyltransferase)